MSGTYIRICNFRLPIIVVSFIITTTDVTDGRWNETIIYFLIYSIILSLVSSLVQKSSYSQIKALWIGQAFSNNSSNTVQRTFGMNWQVGLFHTCHNQERKRVPECMASLNHSEFYILIYSDNMNLNDQIQSHGHLTFLNPLSFDKTLFNYLLATVLSENL